MATRHGIAFLCTTQALGGIELNVLRIATWLSERGHHCAVACVTNSPLLKRAAEIGLETISLGAPRRYGAFGAARALAKELEERGLSFLVMNAPRDMNLGVLARRAGSGTLRLIQIQHMQFGRSKKDAFHSWEYRQLDAWIAPLPWLARQTRDNTNLSSDRIHIIPFGIELRRFMQHPPPRIAREQLGLPLDAWMCGTVGRFDHGKGQEYLLRAIAELRTQGADIHALIVGEDTRGEGQGYGTRLHSMTEELDIADRIHFRPFLDDVETAYAAMNAFVLTSISETYGMVTIEAMASCLPIIATNSAGTPDIISDGRTGLLIPVRDHLALAASLLTLFHDEALATVLSIAAREDAAARFSHDHYCIQLEELFRVM